MCVFIGELNDLREARNPRSGLMISTTELLLLLLTHYFNSIVIGFLTSKVPLPPPSFKKHFVSKRKPGHVSLQINKT